MVVRLDSNKITVFFNEGESSMIWLKSQSRSSKLLLQSRNLPSESLAKLKHADGDGCVLFSWLVLDIKFNKALSSGSIDPELGSESNKSVMIEIADNSGLLVTERLHSCLSTLIPALCSEETSYAS
jgi:hypothetical protein